MDDIRNINQSLTMYIHIVIHGDQSDDDDVKIRWYPLPGTVHFLVCGRTHCFHKDGKLM